MNLVEVSFYFYMQGETPGTSHEPIVVRAGLLDGKLDLVFKLREQQDLHPERLVQALQDALRYAREHVPVEDMVEIDPVV